MRCILAPGVELREIDKSMYSPAMTGTNCLVVGFTDKGEPYVPMEFTSRTAWTSYYGEPDNEAERYAYAAACEVLNQGGRLYFSRLPYDNASFGQVTGFKYNVKTNLELSCERDEDGNPILNPDDGLPLSGTPFFEVNAADKTIRQVAAIEPASAPVLYDLSAIDEYRTDEAKVANNSFLIVDTAFNTYGKIPEDHRKNEKREMIGIMPVVTTAVNALYQQSMIQVRKENVVGFETIGKVRTLNVDGSKYPALAHLSSQEMLNTDACRVLNTMDWYTYTNQIPVRRSFSVAVEDLNLSADTPENNAKIIELVDQAIKNTFDDYVNDSWDGSFQREITELTSGVYVMNALISLQRAFTEDKIKALDTPATSAEYEELKSYLPKFGWHNPGGDDSVPETVSQEANSFFPTIGSLTDKDGNMVFDRDNMKKIGVVVYKMFMDPAEGNKINFEPVEAFAGSLCKTDKDPNTGATTFIDTIVNTNSKYINFFSNCFNTAKDKKYYADTLDTLVVKPGAAHMATVDFTITYVRDFRNAIKILSDVLQMTLVTDKIEDIDLNISDMEAAIDEYDSDTPVESETTLFQLRERAYALRDKWNKLAVKRDVTTPSLGFYSEMTKEDISVSKSIYDGLNKVFEKTEDIIKMDIDIVPDAGIANIASYLKALFGDKGPYDLQITDDVGNSLLGMWKCDSNNIAVKTWKTVEQKFDNFCKNVRKDCMFIADGPRPLVLAGQKKIVRPSKPTNTIDVNIIPNLKWITGLNTSYGACYVDWFEQADDYSGDFFWCPPSIKAMGVYINTDVNYNYWDAPAGLNRGVIQAADVAFSPTIKQAGSFYEKNFNYAINYPQDGIVLEGQKTLQVKPTAFDRVNVRRLFLRLERMCFKVSRYFLYEGNTAYTRQRLIDAIEPYLKDAKTGGGVYDYKIKCDETNNTPETIDRNELHVSVGIKPTKTIEFIMLDFVCVPTGGSWTEAGF